MGFADKLKNLRKENNLTQKDVAERLNVSRSTIAGYETKQRQPSYEKLLVLSNIFHVTIDYLLDGNPPLDCTIEPCNPVSSTSDTHRLLMIYNSLSSRSKEDLLKLAHLLELGDKEQADH